MGADWQLFRRQSAWTAALAAVLVLLLWNIPLLDGVVYPLRLFVTFIHEAGHGLAALLTGGEFIRFEIMANGAGLATTRGGLRAVILPAGYIGAALFGTVLFYINNRVPYPRVVAAGVAGALALLSLIYGETSRVALLIGGISAGVLLLLALLANRPTLGVVMNLLALMTALNAVLDLFTLTRTTQTVTADGRVLNDAAAFALEVMPGSSPAVWAWLWAMGSAGLLGIVVYRSILRPLWVETLVHRQQTRKLQGQVTSKYSDE
ncbi:MAG: M50 family metallopeptidase [Phototrophicaceae bacterium]|jgi:hypothetical protein